MKQKRYVLVLSGGGSKGFYALGILKALEELDMKKNIHAIFGVSAGAMIGSYRTSGWKAEDIKNRLIEINGFAPSNLRLPPLQSIYKDKPVWENFAKDLPASFSDLELPLYIGATDLRSGQYILFNNGELIPAMMGSISLPGILPAVVHKEYLLVDGGVINNFPANFAKKLYPNLEIIGVVLSKFKKNQEVKNLIENLMVSFDLLLTKENERQLNFVDHLFYRDNNLKITEMNVDKIEKAFQFGYKDAKKYFVS